VIWDAKKGDFVSIIDGGEIGSGSLGSYIGRVAWSSDGEWIAFGAEEKNVSIWDVKNGGFIIPPKRDGNTVQDLAWAPGQKSLLYSFSDDTVWIKEIPSGEVRQVFKGYTGRFDALAWSSDAAFIAAGYWDLSKHGNAKRKREETTHQILLWDVNKEKVITRVATHFSSMSRICWITRSTDPCRICR
jgi:WD40 repeat protein